MAWSGDAESRVNTLWCVSILGFKAVCVFFSKKTHGFTSLYPGLRRLGCSMGKTISKKTQNLNPETWG